MKKIFTTLTIVFIAMVTSAQTPSATLTTSYPVGSDMVFYIGTTTDDKTINIDWGNGTQKPYTVGTSPTMIYDKSAGTTIKIYADEINYLNISSNKITSYSTPATSTIEKLFIAYNQITSLDLLNNSNLKELYCNNNQLTSLTLTNCTGLEKVSISNNQLSNIDLSTNTNITELTCSSNLLTTLNLSSNTLLADLYCANNNLESISLPASTELTEIRCQNNLITNINLADLPNLFVLNIDNNKLATLDVSGKTNLQFLNCNNNLIETINITGCSSLGSIECANNKLLFTTLPIKQPAWGTYTYSPQLNIALPKRNYSIDETIDLSSQLTVSGTATIYTWKTKSGATLTNDLDYTVTNGVFTFKAGQMDSVYCELSNAKFPDLKLNTICISVPFSGSASIAFTTSTVVGSSFSISFAAAADNSPVYINWGDGAYASYTINRSTSSISGTLKSSTVEIIGTAIANIGLEQRNITNLDVSNHPRLKSLSCSSNQLTTIDLTKNTSLQYLNITRNNFAAIDLSKNTNLNFLDCSKNQLTIIDISKNILLKSLICDYNQITNLDVSQNTQLTYVNCIGNKLNFGTLPLRQATWTTYNYSMQKNYTLPKNKFIQGEEIDLSSQSTAGSNATSFTWLTKNYKTLVKDVDYTESDGKITFIKDQSDYLYCVMTNASFPDLYISTDNISIESTEPRIIITTANSGTHFSLSVSVSIENGPIRVDWGDGNITEETVNLNGSNFLFNTRGNTVKIYGTGISNIDVGNNGILNIDVTNAKALKRIMCNNNLLSNIDLSTLSELTILGCSNNNLTSLNLQNNPSINYLNCSSNKLDFATIPEKKSTWTYFIYSPQKQYTLPKKNYALNEEIDLSSLNIVSGNQTLYKWKTKSGEVLLEGTDYAASGGKFAFIRTSLDSVYCEMTNPLLADLTLATSCLALPLPQEPIFTMNTTSNPGSSFTFKIRSSANNSIAIAEWGDGTTSYHTIGTTDSNISGTLKGPEIKVYSNGITYINVSSKKLTSIDISKVVGLTDLYCKDNMISNIDVSKNTSLINLDCSTNKLKEIDLTSNTSLVLLNCSSNEFTFKTLPLKQTTWTSYIYSPQAKIPLSKNSYTTTESVDLTNEYSINGKNSTYQWKTKGGNNLTPGTDYTVTNGITTFLKGQTDSIYCQINNESFPNLTLSTTNIKVRGTTSVDDQLNVNTKIYPNPVSDILWIENGEPVIKVEVFTILGSKIFESNYNSNNLSINTADFPKGILILKLHGNHRVIERKIIKK